MKRSSAASVLTSTAIRRARRTLDTLARRPSTVSCNAVVKCGVRCAVVSDVSRKTLHRRVKDHVEPGATVYTDAHPSYRGLDADYMHGVIDHAITYVQGRVHTNGLENFWSLLKRGLGGTYVAVAPVHLQRYLDEQVFRFNKRKGSDRTRFMEAMFSVCGKRLTYAELTGAT